MEQSGPSADIAVPAIDKDMLVDGQLDEWKSVAFHDSVWNLERVKGAPWYEPKRNRLVVDPGEDTNQIDLEAKYYLAWNDPFLYFGAEVKDNLNDVMDTLHEPKRWYYKDAIALFLEIPRDSIGEKFGDGDHAFCFVADASYPPYGAWWRHGDAEQSYLEEPLSQQAVDYALTMDPWNRSAADYILEARVNLGLLGIDVKEVIHQHWGMMIVHCDPDGGEYGGHLLIHGKGDNDRTWTSMQIQNSAHD